MSVDRLISYHERPVFGMVIRVNECEFGVVHVFVQITARDIDKGELQDLSIR